MEQRDGVTPAGGLVDGPAVEDYRSDRAILEEIAAELARVHKRLDEFEPHARRLLDHPLARLLRRPTPGGRLG